MKSIPLAEYKKAWIFRHQDLPVSDEDFASIKSVAQQRAMDFWRDNVSEECDHPSVFTGDDWAGKSATWQQNSSWQGEWDSNSNELPVLMAEHFTWEANTVVYFCYAGNDILETTWDVFQRCWKNFLFFDDGPLLMGRKRKEVAQFDSSGTYKIGLKP